MKRRSIKAVSVSNAQRVRVNSTHRIIPINTRNINLQSVRIPKPYIPIVVETISALIDFKSIPGTSKIAFMFLTLESLHQGARWHKFLSDGKDKCTVYSHPKYPEYVKQQFLTDSIIPNLAQTKWAGLGLVKATNNLLLEALKDPANKYFMLLSEKCMPLYDFDYIYDKITQKKKSWVFHYKWNNIQQNVNRYNSLMQVKTKFKDPLNFTIGEFYKQSQWMLLNRSHAELIARNMTLTNQFYKTSAPDEHFYINILKNKVPMFHTENINHPITFVNWTDSNVGNHPVEYQSVHLKDIKNANAADYFKQPVSNQHKESHLFMRKVPHTATIRD